MITKLNTHRSKYWSVNFIMLEVNGPFNTVAYERVVVATEISELREVLFRIEVSKKCLIIL